MKEEMIEDVVEIAPRFVASLTRPKSEQPKNLDIRLLYFKDTDRWMKLTSDNRKYPLAPEAEQNYIGPFGFDIVHALLSETHSTSAYVHDTEVDRVVHVTFTDEEVVGGTQKLKKRTRPTEEVE